MLNYLVKFKIDLVQFIVELRVKSRWVEGRGQSSPSLAAGGGPVRQNFL